MERLSFLKTFAFTRTYSVLANVILSLSLVFNLIGILGSPLAQADAGMLVALGAGLLFGQILLALNLVNKRDKLGWILVRFSYVTLFVMILGMLSITVGTLVVSFYVLGGSSTQAMMLFSSLGLNSWTIFGICFTGICFHTLTIDSVWNVQ